MNVVGVSWGSQMQLHCAMTWGLHLQLLEELAGLGGHCWRRSLGAADIKVRFRV